MFRTDSIVTWNLLSVLTEFEVCNLRSLRPAFILFNEKKAKIRKLSFGQGGGEEASETLIISLLCACRQVRESLWTHAERLTKMTDVCQKLNELIHSKSLLIRLHVVSFYTRRQHFKRKKGFLHVLLSLA